MKELFVSNVPQLKVKRDSDEFLKYFFKFSINSDVECMLQFERGINA
tara:strand:+ start:1206 stop:1346 length:141 start_codon:yes stop_codon:yes gene_type:complete